MRCAALALALLALAPARSQVADRLADLRLATAVRLALVDDVRTRPLDVRVTARGGGVEITGDVPPSQRRTVAEVARAVPGVRGVGGLGALGDSPAAPLALEPSPRAAPPAREAPPARAAPPPAEAVYHTVASGDTLFSLARRYETSVQAILDLNGLRSPGIRAGQRLRVR